ncbi:MAG: hypothetical protein QF515_00550 [Pseudomonadales bacterium]|nr:hypothetical protein [Pseudomonadales bacterium]MDP6471213.1 hypothetical protein [Pseudomonadales bacterium]MDP6825598.1 hypothetical protein [Pseudomonadales bacterium]
MVITGRAISRIDAHVDLKDAMHEKLDRTPDIPGQYHGEIAKTVDLAFAFADKVANTHNEPMARQASDALYNAASAVLLAAEGAELGRRGGDARRLIMSRMVINHRLRPRDPLSIEPDNDNLVAALLGTQKIDLDTAQRLVEAS